MKFSNAIAALALAISASAVPFKRDDALAIASDAEALNGLITQATDDTNASDAFTGDEGSTILSAIQAPAPEIASTLENLDSQQGNVASLPIPGIDAAIESELKTLSTDGTALENALSAKSPADDQDAEQTVFNTIDTAFATSIDTFLS